MIRNLPDALIIGALSATMWLGVCGRRADECIQVWKYRRREQGGWLEGMSYNVVGRYSLVTSRVPEPNDSCKGIRCIRLSGCQTDELVRQLLVISQFTIISYTAKLEADNSMTT